MTRRHPRTPRGVRATLAGLAYALGDLLREIGDRVADGRGRPPVGAPEPAAAHRVPDAFVRQGPPQEWLDHVAAGQPEWFGSPAAGLPEGLRARAGTAPVVRRRPASDEDSAAVRLVAPSGPRTDAPSAGSAVPRTTPGALRNGAGRARLVRTPPSAADSTGQPRFPAPDRPATASPDLTRPIAARPAPVTRRARLIRSGRPHRSARPVGPGQEADRPAGEAPPPFRPLLLPPPSWPLLLPPPSAPVLGPVLGQVRGPVRGSVGERAAEAWSADTVGGHRVGRAPLDRPSPAHPTPESPARTATGAPHRHPYATSAPWPALDPEPDAWPDDGDRWSPAPADPAAEPDRGTVPHLWALLTEQRSDATITAQRRR